MIFLVDRSEIINIAKLSKLFIDENEIDEVTKQMDSIIQFANEIQHIDSKESTFDNIGELTNIFRDDEIKDSFDNELILKNASDTKNGYFCLKKSK